MSSFLPSHHPISLLFTEKKTLLPHYPASWNPSSLLSPSLLYNCSYRGHQDFQINHSCGQLLSTSDQLSRKLWQTFSLQRCCSNWPYSAPNRVLRPLPSPLHTYTSWTTERLTTPKFTSPALPSLQHSSCVLIPTQQFHSRCLTGYLNLNLKQNFWFSPKSPPTPAQ